jgi:hypothetical protein
MAMELCVSAPGLSNRASVLKSKLKHQSSTVSDILAATCDKLNSCRLQGLAKGLIGRSEFDQEDQVA